LNTAEYVDPNIQLIFGLTRLNIFYIVKTSWADLERSELKVKVETIDIDDKYWFVCRYIEVAHYCRSGTLLCSFSSLSHKIALEMEPEWQKPLNTHNLCTRMIPVKPSSSAEKQRPLAGKPIFLILQYKPKVDREIHWRGAWCLSFVRPCSLLGTCLFVWLGRKRKNGKKVCSFAAAVAGEKLCRASKGWA
jgi:hypothetical protein